MIGENETQSSKLNLILYNYIYMAINLNNYAHICIYHIEGAVFTTIWSSMYKVQSVDSRNAEKEKTDSLLR